LNAVRFLDDYLQVIKHLNASTAAAMPRLHDPNIPQPVELELHVLLL
jgi:hypothetical protein